MAGLLIAWCLAVCMDDPADRDAFERSPSRVEEVGEPGFQPNRPVAISPRVGAESLPPRSLSSSDRTDTKVMPAVNDRPALQEPADAGAPTLHDRDGGIRLSPASKKGKLASRSRSSAETTAEDLSTGRSVAWWTTTGLGLAVVLTAIFLGGRLAKRFVPGATVGEATGPIHLLHRTFLSPKHAVCMVKCGDRILLIGLSGDRMQTLSEIHDPQEIDYLRAQLMQVRPKSTTQAFREVLSSRTQLQEAETPVGGEGTEESPSSARGNFFDQLSGLRNQISQWKARSST